MLTSLLLTGCYPIINIEAPGLDDDSGTDPGETPKGQDPKSTDSKTDPKTDPKTHPKKGGGTSPSLDAEVICGGNFNDELICSVGHGSTQLTGGTVYILEAFGGGSPMSEEHPLVTDGYGELECGGILVDGTFSPGVETAFSCAMLADAHFIIEAEVPKGQVDCVIVTGDPKQFDLDLYDATPPSFDITSCDLLH